MAGSSNSNNNLMKNIEGSSGFGNSGAQVQSMPPPLNHPKMSEPQAQALAQSQYVQAQVQAHARAAHARFQAQLAQSQKQSLMGGVSYTTTTTNNNSNVNVGVSSPSTVTPMNAKRSGGQKPSSRPPSASGGGASSPLKTMELAPVPHRRKRAPPKNQIPEKVAAFLPQSALYTRLLDFESRVDAALARKKVDFQESVKNPAHVQKMLRIYVFNTFANQTPTQPDNLEPPSWSLKIIGKILDNSSDLSDTLPVLQNTSSTSPKFSSFFKKITIYLDQKLYPDNHVILWDSSRSLTLNEGFEVKRKGDKEFTAIIRLEMNYKPERFKLSSALSEILGLEIETRSRVLSAIWHYVKAKNLQIPDDTSYFTCDAPLRKLFGEEKMKFSMVLQKISQHLTQPGPIHLEHKIKLSGDNNPVGNTCYDVRVDVPFNLDKDVSSFLEKLEKHKEIDACDEVICSAIKKIHEHRRRQAFFLGFSESPGEFINGLVESQSKDLKTAAGDATRNAEKEQRAEFYNQSWVDNAVVRYLNRKPTTGSNAPGST
ncbi:SWI/SNF complex component SNF12 homolog [Bidens hawaiensis]|uniref:SWI/SNF complex component SNF12 homolog n=1 Tax=Bidens hawaiensis TaxID=980011 RepID=UPI00404B24AC